MTKKSTSIIIKLAFKFNSIIEDDYVHKYSTIPLWNKSFVDIVNYINEKEKCKTKDNRLREQQQRRKIMTKTSQIERKTWNPLKWNTRESDMKQIQKQSEIINTRKKNEKNEEEANLNRMEKKKTKRKNIKNNKKKINNEKKIDRKKEK